MRSYWSQWSNKELMSMHGVEIDDLSDSYDQVDDEYMEDSNPEDKCPRCNTGACNYCLMTEW